jgi:hypothetical protein
VSRGERGETRARDERASRRSSSAGRGVGAPCIALLRAEVVMPSSSNPRRVGGVWAAYRSLGVGTDRRPGGVVGGRGVSRRSGVRRECD